MAGNNRVFYSCLGVSIGSGARLVGATSIGITGNRNVSTIYALQNKNPVATYSAMPDIELTISSYLSSFTDVANEPGLSDWTKVIVYAGPDDCPVLAANKKNAFGYALLNSIKYNLPSEGFFTKEVTYKALNKKICSVNESCNQNATGTEGNVLTRQCYSSGRPSVIGNNPITNISIETKINRNFVYQFGTRTPYASYINFPVETSCTYECIVQDFDSVSFDLAQTACRNDQGYSENINIALSGNGGSFSISNARLTDFNYSGGEANSNSNMKFSVTYTGYSTPASASPVIILPETFDDPCS